MSNLELEIFKEEPINSPARVYLMVDGKLYLNKEAMKIVKGEKVFVNIAHNKKDAEDKNIYLLEADSSAKGAKQINKAGYLATQNFIKTMGIDPKEDAFSYSFSESEYMGKRMFLLELSGTRKRKTRKK